MNCQWQVGMLVVRACGSPASGVCSFCGTELCAVHTVTGGDGPACPRCAGSHQGYESTEESEIARERDEYYRPYGGTSKFGEEGYFTGNEGAALSGAAFAPLQQRAKKKYDPKDS